MTDRPRFKVETKRTDPDPLESRFCENPNQWLLEYVNRGFSDQNPAAGLSETVGKGNKINFIRWGKVVKEEERRIFMTQQQAANAARQSVLRFVRAYKKTVPIWENAKLALGKVEEFILTQDERWNKKAGGLGRKKATKKK